MRCLHLDVADDSRLAQVRAKMREEEFISSGKNFLSVLASADVEYLDYIREKLLPHTLSFERSSGPAIGETSTYLHNEPLLLDSTEYAIERNPPSTHTITNQAICCDAEMSDRHDGAEILMESRSATLWPSLPSQIGSASTSPSQTSSKSDLSSDDVTEVRWPDTSSLTPYLHSFRHLNSMYAGLFKHLPFIIELGDSFIRNDPVRFLKTFCRRWDHKGLWYRPLLSNPAEGGSTMEKLLQGFDCAESFKRSSVADLLRLRIARVLLYHHFEELCIAIQLNLRTAGPLPSGKNAASVASDKILDELHRTRSKNFRPQTRKQRLASLQRHKSIGRRWSILATYLGLGIFLICSPSLEAQCNNTRFTERKILALLTYVLHVYPQGSRLSRSLDSFVHCIMQGVSPLPWPTADSLSALGCYQQEREKDGYEFQGEWLRMDLHDGFYRIL